MVKRTQKESISYQRRKNYACNYHKNDVDSSKYNLNIFLYNLDDFIGHKIKTYIIKFASNIELQVSTWFANARRRLKKENKMTWEPKNKLDDEDVDVSDDDDKDDDKGKYVINCNSIGAI